MPARAQTLLKLFLALALLLLIVHQLNLSQLTAIAVTARLPLLLVICLIYPFVIALSTFKWHLLLRSYHLTLPYQRLYALYWVSSLFGTFLPTDFGSDAFKLLHLKRTTKAKASTITTTIIYDRLLGLAAIITLITITLPIHIAHLPFTGNHFPLLIASALTFVLAGFLVSKSKFSTQFTRLTTLLKPTPHPSTLATTFTTSLILILTTTLTTHLAFAAFHQPVPISLLLFLVPLLNLTGLIPLTPQSLGIKEGFGVYLYSLYGIRPEVAFSVLITSRALALICNAFGLPLITRLNPSTFSTNN